MRIRKSCCKIKSLSVDFGFEPYFEGFLMSVHTDSSPSEEDGTSESDDEMQTCSLNPLAAVGRWPTELVYLPWMVGKSACAI